MTITTGPASLPDSVSIEAETVNAQALTINATLNKITTTIAGVWDLDTTEKEVPQTNKVVFVPHQNPASESVIEGDDRTLVDPVHFAPNGKYRSIVKLFIKYENLGDDKFAHGTGWLISPDMFVTAGHNVFSWKANAGRAREIKVYAGYNGSSSVGHPTVEFRKAKRVVTTSQWLSNRGSMAHDIAIVQLDRPFTSLTPFKYIETPPKDKLKLGVVGYPADKIDEQTGEKGGRMYELFEETEYDITTQKDTMLQHYIDSNGGNSGGPVLRGSDLVAIATHVYGGDFNTASVLGRYGNPLQDYLAAFDLPQANPGRINLIPVGVEHISQRLAATGPQVKEITKLGDNILEPRTSADKPESWVFDGAKEIFDIANRYKQIVRPGFVHIDTTMLNIADGRADGKIGDPESNDYTAQQRAILANAVLTAAEVQVHDKGKPFDEIWKTAEQVAQAAPLKAEGQLPNIRYDDFMKAHGISVERAEATFLRVSRQVTAELAARSRSVLDLTVAKTEGLFDKGLFDNPGLTDTSIQEQVEFLQQLQQSIQAAQSQQQQEGFFDDVGDFFTDSVKTVGGSLTRAAVSAGNAFVDTTDDVMRKTVGYNHFKEGMNAMKDAASTAADYVESNVKEKMGIAACYAAGLSIASHEAVPAARSVPENTLGEEEGTFDVLRASVGKISQALIIRGVIADEYLAVQMARPVGELKEEGIFDSVAKFLAKTGSVVLNGASRVLPGDQAAQLGKLGQVLGSVGNK